MSNMNDVGAQYARHLRALKRASKANKAVVFDALASAGIATVIVCFDGEGDSGQISNIAVKGEVDKLPDLPVEIQDAHG
jgi:hypothetical protein